MTEKEQVLHDLFGFEPKKINYLINISSKYKYIYFETPKVGCSTIKRTLHKLELDDSLKIPEDVHDKGLSPLLSPLQLEKNFTEYINDEYFKFSFVRNPYTRVLSCYLDKVVENENAKKRMLPGLGFEPTDNVSFKEFLLAVKKQSHSEMNPHWKPQSNLLAAGKITLDFIGRQEDFDNDLQKVLSKITKSDTDSNKILNERPHAVGANKKLQKYITKDIAKLIEEIYHDDFRLYGYSTDPFNTNPLPTISENLVANSDAEELVSIVIPCYNQAIYLEKSVQSAINQSTNNVEVIIVNDGSPDNTQSVAEKLKEKYPEQIHIVTQKNRGLSEARNSGIRQAKGQYILPLDADDMIEKNMIAQCLKTLKENNADIVYSGLQCFGVQNHAVPKKSFLENDILYENLPPPTSLYKKEVWEKNNGYKANMNTGYEDWEFWINAYKNGFIFKHHREILIQYCTKAESMITVAEKQDSYLKAKIIMNHPELYPIPYVQEAITVIRKTEKLADFYFYYDEKILDNEKVFITAVGNYINENSLEVKQIIEVNKKQVGLLSLDLLTDSTSLKKLYTELDVAFLLFYAPMRYKVEALQCSSFAWKKNQGITKAIGNVFSFVFKEERENLENQLIAYQRLSKYQAHICNEKDSLIRKLRAMISTKDKDINNKKNIIDSLISSIQSITEHSILRSALKKYNSYKKMLLNYDKAKRELQRGDVVGKK